MAQESWGGSGWGSDWERFLIVTVNNDIGSFIHTSTNAAVFRQLAGFREILRRAPRPPPFQPQHDDFEYQARYLYHVGFQRAQVLARDSVLHLAANAFVGPRGTDNTDPAWRAQVLDELVKYIIPMLVHVLKLTFLLGGAVKDPAHPTIVSLGHFTLPSITCLKSSHKA